MVIWVIHKEDNIGKSYHISYFCYKRWYDQVGYTLAVELQNIGVVILLTTVDRQLSSSLFKPKTTSKDKHLCPVPLMLKKQ